MGLNHTSGLVCGRTVGAVCSHESPRGDRRCLKEELTHTRSVCVGVAETGVSFLFLTFGILRLGDAVQRWLRHPEPSSSSVKSTPPVSFGEESIFPRFLSVKSATSSRAAAPPAPPLLAKSNIFCAFIKSAPRPPSREENNPSVMATPCQLPLHNGAEATCFAHCLISLHKEKQNTGGKCRPLFLSLCTKIPCSYFISREPVDISLPDLRLKSIMPSPVISKRIF